MVINEGNLDFTMTYSSSFVPYLASSAPVSTIPCFCICNFITCTRTGSILLFINNFNGGVLIKKNDVLFEWKRIVFDGINNCLSRSLGSVTMHVPLLICLLCASVSLHTYVYSFSRTA